MTFFILTKISGISRGLESLSEGLLNFTEAGKEWEVVAEAESLLVVSAVVEWKPDIGSYRKVYLGAGKNWVWMGARQLFLVHCPRKWVHMCVFQSWCWVFVCHLWKAVSDSLPGAARVATVQESWSSQGLRVVIGAGAVVWQCSLRTGESGKRGILQEAETRQTSESLQGLSKTCSWSKAVQCLPFQPYSVEFDVWGRITAGWGGQSRTQN